MQKNNNYERKPNRFREAREWYNERHDMRINQSDMSKICHTSESTISAIEKNVREPVPSIIRGYSETFNVSMEYLLGYSDAREYTNATVSHELGLTDEAIETLKYIKQMSCNDDDISALVSAFIGNGDKTYSLFRNMFDALAADWLQANYEEHPQADMNRFLMEQEITNAYMNYVKFYIRPELEKVIAQSYKVLMDEANEHTDDMPEKIQDKLSMLQDMKMKCVLE